MNKSELLSTYTAEQLSEMVEKLDIASRMMKEKNSSLEKENRRLKEEVIIYHDYVLPKATKEAYEQIMGKDYTGIRIVTWDEWNNRRKAEGEKVFLSKEYEDYIKEILSIDTSEIKDDCQRFSIDGLQRYLKMDLPKKQAEIDSLKEQLDRSQTTITQIDENLEELFGVKHDAVEYGEFEQFLREKVTEKVADFLPTEPIKVADMLISAKIEPTEINSDGAMVVHKQRNFYLSELRQIAEHLLIYCNHSESDGE